MTTATTSRPGTLAGSRARQGGGLVGLAWLTWRQHRWMIVAGVLSFGLLTAYLLWLDHELGRVAATCADPCVHGSVPDELGTYKPSPDNSLMTLMFVGPFVAAFLAAPLVSREYEQRTNLLVWSQDVRAGYWFAVKASLLVAVAAVLSAVLGFVASNLAQRLHGLPVHGYMYPNLFSDRFFEATPAMQVGYTLFGFALGLAVSAVVRRTVPAMGITLAVFVATRILILAERRYFMPPLRYISPLAQAGTTGLPTTDPYGDNLLLVTGGYLDAAGNKVPTPLGCYLDHTRDSYQSCMRDHGVVSYYTDYQPGSRIGTFHLIEESIFVGLAAVLLVLAWWRVRRATTVG